MRRKTRSRAESGTCNVCAAPCSSCMHLRHMGSKGNEFSDETSHVTATTSQQSGNEDNALPLLKNNKVNESSQPVTSEASNLLSINSSHDSLSENAESRENTRPSETGDTSAESDVALNSQSGQQSSKQKSVLNQRRLSNKQEDSKAVEGYDESKDRDTSVLAKDMGKKNVSGGTGLVSSLGTLGSGKALNDKSGLLQHPSNDIASCGSPKLESNFLPPTEHKNPSLSNDAASDLVRGNNSSVFNADGSPNGKSNPKLEAEAEKDSREQEDEVFNSADQVEQDVKLMESPDAQQPASQYRSGDESDESEIMEHDVKVCDICGDAGREDLLAICSRCSDGAEHTYCMREMLQKVPERDWLCEECKLDEENDNQKQVSDAEDKRKNKLSSHFSGKRHMEAAVAASTSVKRAVEASMGSPKSSSQKKIGVLSRDNSFNSLEKGKTKPALQTSLRDHSGIDIPENARTNSTIPRLQISKGTLLKSNSFNTVNSKPKVKLVDEVPRKPKSSRENSSLDMKEGPARTISKSMSFKSVSSGRSNATESKVKMLPSKFPHVQDMKGLKQYKDRTAFERKSLSKLDWPLGGSAIINSYLDQRHTPRGESVTASSGSSYRDSKVQSEGKICSLSRSGSGTSRKGAEISASSVRASSTSGINNASNEQKPHLISPKDEPTSSSSWNADKQPHIVNENLQDSLTQRESTNQGEKTKDISSSRLRPVSTPGLKGVVCQKCKDIGHSADYCTVTSPRASLTELSTAKSMKEDMSAGSKLKAAIQAAMLKKPGIYGKRKIDQSDGLSMSNGDENCDVPSCDQILSKTHNVISDEGAHEGQVNLGPLTPGATNFGHASATASFLMKTSVVPEHEYIWQGSFEVRRFGKVVGLHVGIQAHLSTCASPKVLEVVSKFPAKITLDEAPRLSTWPRQFHENGAKDDNIALYFFAKDVESYEKNYRILVDNIIQKDLVLRGYFDGVELLIYASTLLPEHSRCWNMLFFLWGVFKGKRASISHSLDKLVIPSLNVVRLDKEIPCADIPYSEKNCRPAESASKETVVYEITSGDIKKACFPPDEVHDKKISSMQTDSQQQDSGYDFKSLSKLVSSEPLLSEVKCSSSSQEDAGDLEMNSAEVRASIQANGSNKSYGGRKEIQMQQGMSCVKEGKSSSNVFNGSKKIIGEKVIETLNNDRDELATNLNKDNTDVDKDAHLAGGIAKSEDLNSWQSNNRKRTYLDLSESAPQTSNSTGPEFLWNKEDSMLAEGESTSKKLKSGFSEAHEYSSIKDVSKSFSPQTVNLGYRSSIEETICSKASDKQVILEDVGTAERYFFPVESHDMKGFHLSGSSLPWREHSSNDDDSLHDRVPNLELALGAETKSPNKEALPFLVGMVEENNVRNKPVKAMDREEDGDSASLSLSLSFPFPEKDQTGKPVSKPEQIMPQRHHVNTSLLLFPGFTDK